MKKKSSLRLLCIFFVFFSCHVSTIADEPEKKRISFRWAFLCINKDNIINPVDYDSSIQYVKQGDRIKIYINPLENVFIYLLHKDADGNLHLLFPVNLQFFSRVYVSGKDYYVPQGDEFISPGVNSGEETFYFIAAESRLIKLESLIKKYFSNGQANNTKKREIRQAIITHIKRLIQEHSSFASPKSEIVTFAGRFRGIDERLEFPVLKIDADKFYALTVRISN